MLLLACRRRPLEPLPSPLLQQLLVQQQPNKVLLLLVMQLLLLVLLLLGLVLRLQLLSLL